MSEKKKILFVTSSYIQGGTSANIRNNSLIDGLCANGHIVDVLSREPDVEQGRSDTSMKLPPIRNFIYVIKRVQQQSTGANTVPGEKKGIKTKLLPYAIKLYNLLSIWDTWYLKVKQLKKVELTESYDIMISSSDPKSSHCLAQKILGQNPGKIGKWIQYWGDPFALDINQTSGSQFQIRRAERELIKNADKVVYVSPFTLEQQRDMYQNYAAKMTFLPIPVRAKDTSVVSEAETDISHLKIGYFGAYKERDRDIKPLYNAVNKTSHFLQIIGPSDIVLDSTQQVKVNEQIRVPVSEIEEKEKTVDVLVCICNRSGTQIPGKAYHYAMTSKYVLIILDGEYSAEIKKYFSQYNRYVFCENNEQSIADALNNLPCESNYRSPCCAFNPMTIAERFIKI